MTPTPDKSSWLERLFEVSHGKGRQLGSMEGLRGLAVFMVFLVHYVTLAKPWLAPASLSARFADAFHNIGNTGVDLFFVLSGYLIYGTLIRKPYVLRNYFFRRFQRIYPAFLAVFALYFVLSWLYPVYSKISWGHPEAALIYVIQNLLLLPGMFAIEPVITVAWSLSYEVFYYLAVPTLIGSLRLRTWSRSNRLMLFLVMAIAAAAYCAATGATQIRLVMFIAGILLYELLEDEKYPRVDGLGLAALVLGLLSIEFLVQGPLRFVVLFVSFLVLCYAAFGCNGLVCRMFCWTPLRWLGNMSYSYYLIHGLALKIAFDLLSRLVPGRSDWIMEYWLLLPPMFMATLLPATLLFATIEKPFSLATSTVRR